MNKKQPFNFRTILCKIGIHNWQYYPAKYSCSRWEILAGPTKPATRECRHCGKFQVEDIHCLGLNPPEYITTWNTKVNENTLPLEHWRKFPDVMPPANKPVLILYLPPLLKKPTMAVGINFDGSVQLRCLQNNAELSCATHWTDLPDLPGEYL